MRIHRRARRRRRARTSSPTRSCSIAIAACGGSDAVDAKVDEDRRSPLQDGRSSRSTKFRTLYFDKGRACFDEVVPKDVPKTVVYPFGGGDLLSALVAFPDATEITTISLELAGDPRRIATLTPSQLETQPRRAARRDRRPDLGRLEHEREPVEPAAERSARPGQLVPARARRRRLRAGVDALLHARRRRRHPLPRRRPRSTTLDKEALAHARRASSTTGSRRTSRRRSRTSRSSTARSARPRSASHRHIGWNLGDDYLKQHPQLIRHLEKKGQVTMLVKGASYLLWRGDFSPHPRLHARSPRVDAVGLDRHPAEVREDGRHGAGDVRRLRRRVPRERARQPDGRRT